MVYSLMYRRPSHVPSMDHSDSSSSSDNESKHGSVSYGLSAGIPPELSFDKIVVDGACPPCGLRDFMNYLLYIEHSAENLQFYLWLRAYETRFHNAPAADQALSPVWTVKQQDSASHAAKLNAASRKRSKTAATSLFRGTDFEQKKTTKFTSMDLGDPFSTPPLTRDGSNSDKKGHGHSESKVKFMEPWDPYARPESEPVSNYPNSSTESFRKKAGDAFEAAGLKVPFTIQPFREEVDRILSIYVLEGSPRELNLSSRERSALMQALQYTTHPSAWAVVITNIEDTLRRQAHPNFIRWAICNGNPARQAFAQGLGLAMVIFGIVIAILLTLSSSPRGWRAIAAILWILGMSTLICGWKGVCVVLHGMHHRHLRPWELFADEKTGSELEMKKSSFETECSRNSYEDEPWVKKYESKNIIRKIFEREVWVKEPALRQIQDTIFIQSMGLSIVLSAILTAVFVVIPSPHMY